MGRWFFYFGMLVISFIFTYIFDIKENYVIIYMMLLMPVADYITYVLFRKNLSSSIKVLNENVEKGQKIACNIEFKNSSIIPIPFIDYKIKISDKITALEEVQERISLGKNETLKKEIEIWASHIGIGEISIEDLEITSIFGLFHTKIQCEESSSNVMIAPKCVEIDGTEKLIESAIGAKDEDGISNYTFQGTPGYEYKEYAPGDPLNRVNWKLSSKKNVIMIRQSASSIKCKKVVILDPFVPNDENFQDNGDLLIEGFIGIVKEMFLSEYEVLVSIYKQNRWEVTNINKISDIEEIQRSFSKFVFCKEEVSALRFDKFVIPQDEKYDLLIITCNKDISIQDFVTNMKDKCHTIELIGNNRDKILPEEFYLQKDYVLERI